MLKSSEEAGGMMDHMYIPDMIDLLDVSVKDIFKRVAGFTVTNISVDKMKTGELWSLVVTTQGDYSVTIVLCSDIRLFYEVVKNMRHGAETGKEALHIYLIEFFNILCGHIISAINIKNKRKARFGIPRFVKGSYIAGIDQGRSHIQEYYYDCEHWPFKMEVIFKDV